ncbi:MAG: threonine dehydratase [Paraglaciecola sp.]|jgi:threonine dehydratase
MNDLKPNPSKPQKLLAACPVYKPSSLIQTTAIASIHLLIKDESHRMELGSFKALGRSLCGSHVVSRKMVPSDRKNIKN